MPTPTRSPLPPPPPRPPLSIWLDTPTPGSIHKIMHADPPIFGPVHMAKKIRPCRETDIIATLGDCHRKRPPQSSAHRGGLEIVGVGGRANKKKVTVLFWWETTTTTTLWIDQ